MFFFFTCGTHIFTSQLKGYENVVVQCANCGNHAARVFKRWEWFTFCFIPLIPFSLKPWKEVGCPVCNFYQDIKYRPDVMNHNGAQNQIPLQEYGVGKPQPPHGGPGQFK